MKSASTRAILLFDWLILLLGLLGLTLLGLTLLGLLTFLFPCPVWKAWKA
jgi:hypothetical protein